jgi:hypothetical protein
MKNQIDLCGLSESLSRMGNTASKLQSLIMAFVQEIPTRSPEDQIEGRRILKECHRNLNAIVSELQQIRLSM